MWARILRRLLSYLPQQLVFSSYSWRFLAYCSAITPTDALLQNWNSSHWEEYQRWLINRSLQTENAWLKLHLRAKEWNNPPRISIVTPVHNTQPEMLYECILSVLMQTYPYWQLVLVNDGSTSLSTLRLLDSGVCKDLRIHRIVNEKVGGISSATNIGLIHAKGDYVIFLDHDDRLSLDALSLLATEITNDSSLDIIYSDRDMISEQGKRYMHAFKPGWSPENLLAGNYIFHLMCYRRSLLQELGGLRAEYDGSQDYDLILRAAESRPKVFHIAKVLYHWRQHSASIALNSFAKDYTYQSGVNALNDAIRRRKIPARATEIKGSSRGMYRLHLNAPKHNQLAIFKIGLSHHQCETDYARSISEFIAKTKQPFIAIIRQDITPVNEDTLLNLAAWLQLDEVGLVSGKILDNQHRLEYIGMAYQKSGALIYPYRGFPESESGYLGVAKLVRNISAPHPFCVVFRRSIWHQLQGFDTLFNTPLALLDFALRAKQVNWRTICAPDCQFVQHSNSFQAERFCTEHKAFSQRWHYWLQQGDPYYNPNLSEKSKNMGLDI